jgi:hypothetical protein
MEIGRNSRSLKVYKNTGNLDYNDVFSALNEPRYMNTYISCLRDIPNKYMKVHYYGGSVKLKPIKNGYTQIINEINYCLKRAEAVVKKYDKDY